MIVGDLKSLKEIASSIAGYRKVLILGCGGCVTVCRSGGDAEAHDLARRLSHPEHHKGVPPDFVVDTIERQCENDLLKSYLTIPQGTEADLIPRLRRRRPDCRRCIRTAAGRSCPDHHFHGRRRRARCLA